MSWQPVDKEGIKPPVGAYSRAIKAGNHVYVSGHTPIDPETGALLAEGYTGQTVAVLNRLEETLAAAGATLRDVVSVNAYIADMAYWGEFNTAYRNRMTPPYPTRTTVGAQLANGILVEISAVAYVGD